MPPTDLTIIIVNWNTRDLVLRCLESIFTCIETLSYGVVVVDNASSDGSAEAVRERFPQVRLIVNQNNEGFAGANNQILPQVSSRYAMLLNSDTELIKGAVETLVGFMDENPGAGIAAPQYLNPDGSRQNSFDNFPGLVSELLNKSLLKIIFPGKYPSKRKDYQEPLAVDSVIGACMLVRAEAMAKVGVLDGDYFFFLEETDWCYRMRQAGYGVYHVPGSRIYHIQGASKNKAPDLAWIEYYRSSYLFFKKNRSTLAWVVLRIFRPVKLGVNFLLASLAVALTLGMKPRPRRKWKIYARLCLWHLRLCPDDMGLRAKR
ncbi:MAG: glycosyltransferase family 2 protein [Thermodesulfobacteriota bacterium]